MSSGLFNPWLLGPIALVKREAGIQTLSPDPAETQMAFEVAG